MNRRTFLGCTGACGCALLTGCGTMPKLPGTVADKTDWDISACGLNCARCKMMLNGDCQGCRGSIETHWSPDCEFRPCAESKGHQYCFVCAEFPCGKLKAFSSDGCKHHQLTVENMKSMKALGLDEWIARQDTPMFCPGWHF